MNEAVKIMKFVHVPPTAEFQISVREKNDYK